MKVRVTFELDTIAEAQEVMQAVKLLKDKPYRLTGFGDSIVKTDPEKEIDMFVESVSSATSTPPQEVAAVQPDRQAARPNVNPGEPSISKIGTNTKEELLNSVRVGIPMNPHKYSEHMKLLWKRGEVKYDGKEYYL